MTNEPNVGSEAGKPNLETAQPSGPIHIRVGQATDRGLRRQINEDSLIARTPVFAVADGMGGHEAGEVASRICVETFESSALFGASGETDAADVLEVLERANQQIRTQTDERAGTTVSGAVLVTESGAPYWLVFNVGDSRTYRLINGELAQITVDHSEVQELVDMGEITPAAALVHPRRHVVTRALGAGQPLDADFWLLPVTPGERMLICSDGLTNELSDADIRSILGRALDAPAACRDLVDAALRSGGRDNITVIVLDPTLDDVPHQEETMPRFEEDESLLNTLPRPVVQSGSSVVGSVETLASDEPSQSLTHQILGTEPTEEVES